MPGKYQSKKYRFTKTLAEVSLISYFCLVIGLYLFSVLVFAIFYWSFDLLRYSSNAEYMDARVTSIFHCLYFSVITQTTTGYGDITPVGYGRLVAGIQVLYGTIYLAVFIGLYLLRYIWTPDVVRVSEHIAFDPDERVFRIHIVNLSAFDMHNIDLKLWENSDKPEDENKFSNKPFELVYTNPITFSSMAPWRIKTLPVEVERVIRIFRLLRKFYFQIDGKFVFANYVNTFKIGRDKLLCGDFAVFRVSKQSTKEYKNFRWKDFDVVLPRTREKSKCQGCVFKLECTCVNKYPLEARDYTQRT